MFISIKKHDELLYNIRFFFDNKYNHSKNSFKGDLILWRKIKFYPPMM